MTLDEETIKRLHDENASLRAAIRLHQTVEKAADAELTKLNLQNDEALRAMNDVHSLLSLIRHRHLPRGLDLERDIDNALDGSEKLLDPWWKKAMQRAAKRKDES